MAYTGASRNSGINNWEVTKRHIDGDREVQQRFGRIRDIAAKMRPALERSDWPEVGKQVAEEWENRKGLAPGVTTPTIDAMLAAAGKAGAWSGKVCGAGGGGCLFCIGPPEAVPAIAAALQAAGAKVLDCRVEHKGVLKVQLQLKRGATLTIESFDASSLTPMDNQAIARVFAQIGDLLEIKAENPFKIRAYRNAAETIIHTAERIADLSPVRTPCDTWHRQGPRCEDRRAARDRRHRLSPDPAAGISLRRSWTCSICRESARRPSRCSIESCRLARSISCGRHCRRVGCAGSRAWAPRRNR